MSASRDAFDARQRDFAAEAKVLIDRLLRSRALTMIPFQDRYDVLQECLLGAWRRWDTIEKLDDRAKYAYVHQIAHHQMAKYFDRKRRTDELRLRELSFAPTEGARNVEVYLQNAAPEVWNISLWRAIANLSNQQRAVLLLRHLDGFSTHEVAGLLAISEGAVKTHLKRAISRVAELLEIEERS